MQSWQRNLPHRGFARGRRGNERRSCASRTGRGPLARVELYADWAFDGAAHGIFGRMSYAGKPVHGFHTTSQGAPTDGYGRSLYIDTHDSPYEPGWKRETSIVFRKPTGAFCYSFWPTHDVSLPGSPRGRRATATAIASASSGRGHAGRRRREADRATGIP